MSKSRSEEKDREKERDKAKEKEREAERDQENQEEEEALQEENTEQEIIRQRYINQMHLSGDDENEQRSPMSDTLMLRNEASIPSSPPPSYEHVFEQQTRLQHEAEVQTQKCVDALDGRHYATRPHKNTNASGNGQKTQAKGPEILHKSSKEFYRAVAKQWGITCKMSDHCRCLDCQSRYFDCEYEKNDNQKTDGGLGAGTPMFISEVMQGSGCVLL